MQLIWKVAHSLTYWEQSKRRNRIKLWDYGFYGKERASQSETDR